MKVKELKEVLNKLPENMEIVTNISEGVGYKLNSCFEYKNVLVLHHLINDDEYFCKDIINL